MGKFRVLANAATIEMLSSLTALVAALARVRMGKFRVLANAATIEMLSSLTALILLAIAADSGVAQPRPAQPTAGPGVNVPLINYVDVSGATAAAAPGPDGQQLMAQAARELFQQPALEAKIRQRIDLFGHQLVGSGSYQQLGDGPEKLLRLELKLQVGNQITSLQQVSDGRFLWIRRDLPGQTSLSRIDLKQVRDAIRASGQTPAPDPGGNWMALGGLPRLLQGLNENFLFNSPPRADQVGQVPVWVLRGQWRAERLAAPLPNQRADILAGRPPRLEELPPRLPDSVMITLGRDDVLPLFPYRIEYLRQDGAGQGSGAGPPGIASPRSLVTMELFEVRRRADLDPRQFDYKPGDQEVADHTESYLKSLGLKP